MSGPDPATLTFSTRHLPPPSRPRALHELSEQGLLPVVPLADRTPRVDLVKWRLPGVSILSGRFGGGAPVRPARVGRRGTGRGRRIVRRDQRGR